MAFLPIIGYLGVFVLLIYGVPALLIYLLGVFSRLGFIRQRLRTEPLVTVLNLVFAPIVALFYGILGGGACVILGGVLSLGFLVPGLMLASIVEAIDSALLSDIIAILTIAFLVIISIRMVRRFVRTPHSLLGLELGESSGRIIKHLRAILEHKCIRITVMLVLMFLLIYTVINLEVKDAGGVVALGFVVPYLFFLILFLVPFFLSLCLEKLFIKFVGEMRLSEFIFSFLLFSAAPLMLFFLMFFFKWNLFGKVDSFLVDWL